MTETPKPSSQKSKSSLLNVVLTSGLVIAVLGWLFQMQGRAYRTAYLDFYKLDYADFPLSTSELQWLTLVGWTEVSLLWFGNSWQVYLDMLRKSGLLVLVTLLAAFWIFQALRRYWPNLRNLFRRWYPKLPSSPSHSYRWISTRLREVFAISASVLVAASVAPAALWVASFGLLLAVIVTLLPFETAGKLAAREACSKDLESLELVHLSDTYTDMSDVRKILCAEDRCAVISGNKPWTIPRSAIIKTEIILVTTNGNGATNGDGTAGFCPLFEGKEVSKPSEPKDP